MKHVGNPSETIQQLRSEIMHEIDELRSTEEKLHELQLKEAALKKELPELLTKMSEDKHQLFVTGNEIDKLRTHLRRLQSLKSERQNELNEAQKFFMNGSRHR